MTSNDADLLPRLRHSTGPLHDRIEALLQLEAPMPMDRYGRILRGFHEFLQLWEQRVRFALPQDLRPWFDDRRRASLALQDLADLSIPDTPDLRQSARDAQTLIRMDSPAVAFGALYVIEGSALGGQVLVPQLKRHLGLRPDHGARYFHGFGERTGALWRDFRQVAQQQVGADETAVTDALRGAAQTFEALLQTFAVLEARPLPSSTQDTDSRASQALV